MTRLPSLFGRNEPIGSLFREVERVFDEFARQPFSAMPALGNGLMSPRIDVSETPEAIDVTAELPGVMDKDVEVTVSDRTLTIRGEKKVEREEKDKNWHVVERSHGTFQRTIALGFDPDPAKVEAKFEKGVLSVRLPKPPEAAQQPKKIEIKAA